MVDQVKEGDLVVDFLGARCPRAGLTWLVESADSTAISHFIVPVTGARIRID